MSLNLDTLAIITARWNSIRLPHKMLLDLCGKPLLQWVYDGVKRARHIKKTVIATSINSQPIIDYCKHKNIPYYAGAEDDILDRIYQCAKIYGGQVIIRIWGDSPLIPSSMLDNALTGYNEDLTSYYTCEDKSTGYIISLMNFALLEKTWQELKDPHHREWIHKYFQDNAPITRSAIFNINKPKQKLTIDTQADFNRARQFIEQNY